MSLTHSAPPHISLELSDTEVVQPCPHILSSGRAALPPILAVILSACGTSAIPTGQGSDFKPACAGASCAASGGTTAGSTQSPNGGSTTSGSPASTTGSSGGETAGGGQTGTTASTSTGSTTGGPTPANGSWQAPFVLELTSNASHKLAGDTSTHGLPVADAYSCAPGIDEGGPELVWKLKTGPAGLLSVTLDDVAQDAVDIDVHFLSGPTPDACLARNNRTLAQRLEPNKEYWLSFDTYRKAGVSLSGAFVADLNFVADIPNESCPSDMVPVFGGSCMDRFEAPNRAGAKPFVMFSFNEAAAWCAARSKRLCFDDEWTRACEGSAGSAFPYGDAYDALACNTAQRTVSYSEALIASWPAGVSLPEVESLDSLIAAARQRQPAVADHIAQIYLGAGSGEYPRCTNEVGAYDLTGNVEEWTRRRDGGVVRNGVYFSGNLKGRFWSQVRDCHQDLTAHADPFRYYEIGFRCCR